MRSTVAFAKHGEPEQSPRIMDDPAMSLFDLAFPRDTEMLSIQDSTTSSGWE
jgi:hypothetical protein